MSTDFCINNLNRTPGTSVLCGERTLTDERRNQKDVLPVVACLARSWLGHSLPVFGQALRFHLVHSCYLDRVTGNESTTRPDAGRRARLKLAGTVVLVLGLVGAGVVYWLGTRSPDLSGDLSMVGFNKARTQQMARLYGKSGLLIDEWFDELKKPGTQAFLILAIATFVAGGCFYFARLSAEGDGAHRGRTPSA
jgi:hypothetical protein